MEFDFDTEMQIPDLYPPGVRRIIYSNDSRALNINIEDVDLSKVEAVLIKNWDGKGKEISHMGFFKKLWKNPSLIQPRWFPDDDVVRLVYFRETKIQTRDLTVKNLVLFKNNEEHGFLFLDTKIGPNRNAYILVLS